MPKQKKNPTWESGVIPKGNQLGLIPPSIPETAYSRLITALEKHGSRVEERGNRAQAQCPAHDDNNPSLSIKPGDECVLLLCHAGCHTEDVVTALNMRMGDLFDNPRGKSYTYDDGRVVHRSPDKKFRQSGNTKGTPILYRRLDVLDAIDKEKTVYLVEGEKDADTLTLTGVTATTAPGGAGMITRADLTPLHGGKVVVVVDKDEQGIKWAATVRDALEGHTQSLQFVQAATGKDASDHVTAGHDLTEFSPLDLDRGGKSAQEIDEVQRLAPTLLDEVETFVRRFCVLPSEHAYIATTLWAAHTHFITHLETTGRLACLSPEPGSGKTRVLEVLDTLTNSPLLALDLSMSAFFRIVDDHRPTILLDEVDAIFTGKAKSEGTEDLRRVINNGYRVGAVVQRVGGPNRDQVQAFKVFTPVAMAGLGNLPDTLMSRSIILRMKRRAPGERVEPWRDRIHRPEGQVLQAGLTTWAQTVDELTYPQLPDGVEDRDADVWEPLIMVADQAGGHWPQKARDACLAFIAEKPVSSVSLGVRLLTDLKTVWADDAPVMATVDVLEALRELEDSPWGDLYGEGLKPRKLAQLLGEYEVRVKDVRTPFGVLKGYRREDLWDVWQRYVPTHSPQMGDKGNMGDSAGQSVADENHKGQRPPPKGDTLNQKGNTENAADLHKRNSVADVADVADSTGNVSARRICRQHNLPMPEGKCIPCTVEAGS